MVPQKVHFCFFFFCSVEGWYEEKEIKKNERKIINEKIMIDGLSQGN